MHSVVIWICQEEKIGKLKEGIRSKTRFLFHLVRVCCAKVEGDEGQPDDAGRVHREPDELRLVEVFGNIPVTIVL